MAFGLSFGKKGSKTNSTTTVDKTEVTNQAQTGTNTSSGTTNTSQTGSTSGSTTGQQTTSQTGTSQQTGTTTGQTQQQTSSFSDSTLGAIEKAVSDLFGTVGNKTPVSNFDASSFVRDGLSAVQSDVQSNLDQSLGGLADQIGSSLGGNSMAALLQNRMVGDAASEVAGARANLTSQAEQIQRENALASTQIQGQDQNFLSNLLAQLKGGVTTTTGSESQTQNTSGSTTQNGQTNTSEQTSQQSQQQSTQTQQLIEMMSQLLSGTTNTTGTENTKGKTTSSGGGFSLGL